MFKTVLTAVLTVMSGLDPHSIRNMNGMVGKEWLDLVGPWNGRFVGLLVQEDSCGLLHGFVV